MGWAECQWGRGALIGLGMPKRKLPKFHKPPVTEVFCAVHFADLADLHAPNLGDVWDVLGRKQYPRVQTLPRLPPFQITAGIPQIIFRQEGDPGRTWFISSDDASLIQIQRDRLIFNWRQHHLNNPYPSYRVVISNFRDVVKIFDKFLRSSKIGSLNVVGLELGYINNMQYGRELAEESDIGNVFPDFFEKLEPARFLKKLSTLNWITQFPLPDGRGNLTLQIQTVQRRTDGEPLLRADLVARHFAEGLNGRAMWNWFNLAHEWIVCGFADVTSPKVQSEFWERYQ